MQSQKIKTAQLTPSRPWFVYLLLHFGCLLAINGTPERQEARPYRWNFQQIQLSQHPCDGKFEGEQWYRTLWPHWSSVRASRRNFNLWDFERRVSTWDRRLHFCALDRMSFRQLMLWLVIFRFCDAAVGQHITASRSVHYIDMSWKPLRVPRENR